MKLTGSTKVVLALAAVSLGAWVAAPTALAGIVTAGTLFVDLDARDPSAGTATWINTGSLGNFAVEGSPVAGLVGGVTAVTFNGSPDAYRGPASVPGLEGSSDRTIEVWAHNPSLAGEETLVAWSKRGGPNRTNMSFNYGNNWTWGAVGHWGSGGIDMGWMGNPAAGQWHHLVYTYDGAVARVYADGVLKNVLALPLNTHAGETINVNRQNNPATVHGTLSIAGVRVHDGALSYADVVSNYNADAARFGLSSAHPYGPDLLQAAPVHRYSFSADATDSLGGAHGKLINNTGNAVYGGGQLLLGNDGSQRSNANNGDYVDLPNGMISALGKSATFEVWTTWNGPTNSNWQRIFDFGISDGGEDTSPGAPGSPYIFLTPRNSVTGKLRFGFQWSPPRDERVIDGFAILPDAVEKHIVVTWDGDTNLVKMYLDGDVVAVRNDTHFELSDLNDLNNWLGRAQWNDPMYTGSYNEFRIYDYALSDHEVLGNFIFGPDYYEVVPEPATLALLGLGLAALARRRR